MSNTEDASKKWKKRWEGKGKLLRNSVKEGALLSPSIATTQVARKDEYQEDNEQLKDASNPENNALSTLMTPDIPEPEEQPIMPLPDEALQANEARRRRAKQSRTGRQSTILTGLGG
jgi:hypothetical protein